MKLIRRCLSGIMTRSLFGQSFCLRAELLLTNCGIKYIVMVLHLSPSRLISEVQTEFNNIYPYLKVEFYSKAGPGRGKHHLAHSLSLKHAGLKKAGEFQLSDKTTVMQFEKDLKEKFSLTSQICRKSGNIWLETTITDNWTLKQQNEHGKELSSPANKKPNQESPEIMN